MSSQCAILFRVGTGHCKMRRMLPWQYQSQGNVFKIQHGPALVLITDIDGKFLAVPVNGTGNVIYLDCNMMNTVCHTTISHYSALENQYPRLSQLPD